MSFAQTCCSVCNSPISTAIPGPEGDPGADGANGIYSFTLLTDNATIPAVDSNVTVSVADSTWMGVGQIVFLSDGTDFGHFEVISPPASSTSATLQFKGFNGDASPAAVIGSGGTVSPAGPQSALAAPLPSDFTDNSGGTASDTIAAGVGTNQLVFHLNLDDLAVGAEEVLTDYTIGFAFEVVAIDFAVGTVGAGVGATQTLNIEIGSTALTGGVLNVTLANTATKGAVVAGTAITGNNVGTAASVISILKAAGGTQFSAGDGNLIITVKNLDTANAIASLAEHVDELIVALT